MTVGGEEKNNLDPTQFEISSYSEGYFEPSGNRIEVPFDAPQLDYWNGRNSIFGGKLIGEGQKLILPTSAKNGSRIVCGRDQDRCDVVIDADPANGGIVREQSVSRQHFAIEADGDKWQIEDLGSTNGTKCHREHGGLMGVELKETNEPWVLQNGDIVYLGGGPGAHGRLIGFRFYSPDGQNPYLVKFNAASLEELLSASGYYQQNPELIGNIPSGEFAAEVREDVVRAADNLITLNDKVWNSKNEGQKDVFLKSALEYELGILTTIKELGDKHYNGDFSVAAEDIGDFVFDKANKIRQNGSDPLSSADALVLKKCLDIHNRLMDLRLLYGF